MSPAALQPAAAPAQPERERSTPTPIEPPAPPIQGPDQLPGEVDGPKGPEPTRFGDWEKDGRCSDF